MTKTFTKTFTKACRALTPQQREIATSLYFDDGLSFMAAVEASQLVTK